jgi:adhesin/invasin
VIVRAWRASFVVPAAVLLLCTCESFPSLPTIPPTADTVTLLTALPQTATVGAVLATTVVVKDASGNPLPRYQVTFAVTSGGGSVSPLVTLTDDEGKASTQWTLGPTAGQQQAVVTAGGRTTPLVVTGTAGAATQIAASAGANGQTAPPGAAVPVPPSVIVRDTHGNPKAGVAVTFAVVSGGGSVTGSAATTDASGIATVGSWTLGPVAQTNTMTATSPGLAGSPVTFTATAVAVSGTLTVNGGNNQIATVNTAVAIPPSVAIRDANNNPVVGATVTFAVASGGGSATGVTALTNGSGVATVGSWTLGPIAGTNTLTATSASGVATFTATGIAASPATISVYDGHAQIAVSGSPVVIPPSVVVRDQYGNPVSGVTVTFSVVAGGGSVTGSQATTNALGIATVGSWILGPGAGVHTLMASIGGLTIAFSATATAAIGVMSINGGNNQTATVNTAVATPPSVIVRDLAGNPIGGASVTFAVVSGGGSVTGATATTNAGGIATVGAWTLGTTAGANTLRASSTSGSVTFSATGVAGPATQIAVSAGNNQSAVVGGSPPAEPRVIVRDAFNNPKSGVTVTWAVASGGGSITGATSITNTNGLATVGSWTLGTTAGPNTITASSPGLTGSPVTFTATATPGAPTQMTVNAGNGQTASAGAAVATPPSVLVRDQYGNPVSGVTVTFTVASGGGSVSGSPAITNASGIATVGSWTLGSTPGANTLTATSGSLTVTFTATGQ